VPHSRTWPRTGYDLIATQTGYILGFNLHPQLDPRAVGLQCGRTIEPGALLTAVGGKYNSAGYFNIEMNDGFSIKYVGIYEADEGDFVCFDEYHGKNQKPLIVNGYLCALFAFQLLEEGLWMFTTPGVSGRLVQTEEVKFASSDS